MGKIDKHVLLPSLEVIVKKTVLFLLYYVVLPLIFSSSHQRSRLQSPHPQKSLSSESKAIRSKTVKHLILIGTKWIISVVQVEL